MSDVKGVIYKITCRETGMSYIGQAKLFKTKNGVPYNYGSRGRWNDHKCTAKKMKNPLSLAIQQYGSDMFDITDIEVVDEANLDEREAYWIDRENTVVPFGYNVNEHSRSKHNRETTLYNLYIDMVRVAELHPVCNKGVPRFVYLYLYMKDDSTKRLTFGQNATYSFDESVKDAREFVGKIGCEVKDFTNDLTFKPQRRTTVSLEGNILDITITSASNLVAVYFFTDKMNARSEMNRICFGGKTKSKEIAYQEALAYVESLKLPSQVIINDKLKTT